MLRGVTEANYFVAFEISLMQRAMIQASYTLILFLSCTSDSCNNNDTTLVAWYNYNMYNIYILVKAPLYEK